MPYVYVCIVSICHMGQISMKMGSKTLKNKFFCKDVFQFFFFYQRSKPKFAIFAWTKNIFLSSNYVSIYFNFSIKSQKIMHKKKHLFKNNIVILKYNHENILEKVVNDITSHGWSWSWETIKCGLFASRGWSWNRTNSQVDIKIQIFYLVTYI